MSVETPFAFAFESNTSTTPKRGREKMTSATIICDPDLFTCRNGGQRQRDSSEPEPEHNQNNFESNCPLKPLSLLHLRETPLQLQRGGKRRRQWPPSKMFPTSSAPARFEEATQAAGRGVYKEFNKKSSMQIKKAWRAADFHGAGNEYYKLGKYSKACAMYGQALQYVPSNCVLLCKQRKLVIL